MTYQDKMTLGEIAENDAEMFDHIVIRNARRVQFTSRKQAHEFMKECLKATIELCGVRNAAEMNPKELDAAEQWHGIKIEHRDRYRCDDEWRNGFYIYKHDELVAFTSDVNGGSRLIYRGLGAEPGIGVPDRFWVVTSARGVSITSAKVAL